MTALKNEFKITEIIPRLVYFQSVKYLNLKWPKNYRNAATSRKEPIVSQKHKKDMKKDIKKTK